jgi:hypothetical protein
MPGKVIQIAATAAVAVALGIASPCQAAPGPNDSSASSKPEAQMAHPARIILLRHGEKKNASKLCSVGQLRAQALSDQYLGKGAPGNDKIFGKGGKPDAFFAITVHTQETATPSARSWGKQLIVFSVPAKDPNEESDLDVQTEKAAAALDSSEYDGKIIVVVWEHKHIAKKDLNRTGVTLWSLLNLGKIPNADVPHTWEGVNYDYFWVMDYTNSEPTFTAIRQEYAAADYAQVPNNAWGEPVDKSKFPQFYSDCEQNL